MRARLFRDDHYRVTSNLVEAPEGKPFVISFSSFTKNHDPLEARAFSRGFGVDAVLSLGFNCIEFSTNRNDWYQGKSAEQAISVINAYVPQGSRVITYGSSMGGFAAINFAEQLNADRFFAISPQASVSPGFLERVKDARWRYERSVLEFNHDHILNGVAAKRKGVILYDDKHSTDAAHAAECAEKSAGQLVAVSYSGHPSGLAVNQHYGLKKMLVEIIGDCFDAAAVIAALTAKNETSIDYLAGHMENIDAFADRLLKHPEELTRRTMKILVMSLHEYQQPVSPLLIAFCSTLLRASEPLFENKMSQYQNLQKRIGQVIKSNARNPD